jgi:aminoglycoside/choline kinase family phosphotransferase
VSVALNSSDVAALTALHRQHFAAEPETIEPVRAHGSERRIYRLRRAGATVVGVVNADQAENRAFVSFSRHFRHNGVPVPEIIATDSEGTAYLEEDLGPTTLFELLQDERKESAEIPPAVAEVYERAVRWLPQIQVRAGRDIDDRVCYPRSRFDRQSMLWDLNYFKYYFLKLAHVAFHEQELENDFEALTRYLLQSPGDFFLYRDFQSRNIMVRAGEPWFIDYQGGRRGALQYDLASLLVDAKANLPQSFRERLIEVYLDALRAHVAVERAEFLASFDAFTLIRILQAMGAYGYRGFYERKTHFLQSVPFAVRNLERLLETWRAPLRLPALFGSLEQIIRSSHLRSGGTVVAPLTVRVESFSYKRGPLADASGHGGGFVFDCRLLPNPGREVRFMNAAGDEPEVEAWLEAEPEVRLFLARSVELVQQAVDAYQRRGFTHLSVGFGCTGGQHRSVYSATQLARVLRERKGVHVELRHRDVVRPPNSARVS